MVQFGRAVINQKGTWCRIRESLGALGHQTNLKLNLKLVVANRTSWTTAKLASRTDWESVKLVRQG
jgi:hypothetical protein